MLVIKKFTGIFMVQFWLGAFFIILYLDLVEFLGPLNLSILSNLEKFWPLFFKLINFIFWRSFKFIAKWGVVPTQHPIPKWYICYNQWLYTDTPLSSKVHSWEFNLICSDKYIMTYIYHCSITQKFHCPKDPVCSAYLSHPPLRSLATTNLFTDSIILPIAEYHRAGIIQYLAFSD